jgi:hypothetical protein
MRHLLQAVVIGVLLWSFSYANGTGDAIGSVLAVSPRLRSAIPEISTCRQLILVTTGSWEDVSATVHLYKRGVRGKASRRSKWLPPFSAVWGQRIADVTETKKGGRYAETTGSSYKY